MQIIKNEKQENKKPSKAEAVKKGVEAAVSIYGKHVEKKAEKKTEREKFVKENPVTKKQPLPSFSMKPGK